MNQKVRLWWLVTHSTWLAEMALIPFLSPRVCRWLPPPLKRQTSFKMPIISFVALAARLRHKLSLSCSNKLCKFHHTFHFNLSSQAILLRQWFTIILLRLLLLRMFHAIWSLMWHVRCSWRMFGQWAKFRTCPWWMLANLKIESTLSVQERKGRAIETQ